MKLCVIENILSEIKGIFPLDIMQKDPIKTMLTIRGELIWPGQDDDDQLT